MSSKSQNALNIEKCCFILPLESLGFHRQQMFDVSAAREDAFQVDPATLDIDPNVKQSHDAIELVLPAQGIFLKHLGKKRAWLHSSDN